MHDISELESHGIPGVYVVSDEFITAGEAQARAIGFDPARVHVPHPIQDRTDEELQILADEAVDEIIAAVTRHGDSLNEQD